MQRRTLIAGLLCIEAALFAAIVQIGAALVPHPADLGSSLLIVIGAS